MLQQFYQTVEKKMGVKKPAKKHENKREEPKIEEETKIPPQKKPILTLKQHEQEVHKLEISKLDEEIDSLEKRLGVRDSKQKQRLGRSFANENYDDDMLDFLDKIDDKVKGELKGGEMEAEEIVEKEEEEGDQEELSEEE